MIKNNKAETKPVREHLIEPRIRETMSEKLWSPGVSTISFKVQTFQSEQFKSILFICVLSKMRSNKKSSSFDLILPEQIYSRGY